MFDPNAHLRRFFGEGNKGEYLFLVDEAHNLVERGRAMYSAELYKEDILKIKRLVKHKDPKLTIAYPEKGVRRISGFEQCITYLSEADVSYDRDGAVFGRI